MYIIRDWPVISESVQLDVFAYVFHFLISRENPQYEMDNHWKNQ